MKTISLFLVLFMCSIVMFAQHPSIHPVPQSINISGESLNLPTSFKYKTDKNIDEELLSRLKDVLKGEENAKGFTIIVGTSGDKSVQSFVSQIPKKKEGYYLLVENNKIVIAGNDNRGTYYGIQTLNQLIKDKTLFVAEIKDYPDIAFRGVVEGFYGTPWSYKSRLNQIEFYGNNKLNTYIYGPKDDPYHSSPNWRKPYPEDEAKQISNLVKTANKNKVDFVWAIHPGKDIKWTTEDRDLLLQKFESMYGLGVRSFAVFFDDIWGEGANPDKQTELLNYIDNQFIQKKEDVTPLVMCPTEYNKSWSNIEKGYLPTLGNKLNADIQIMWTGDGVCVEIKEESLDWINKHIKRPAYIWWNFPVSDYVRDHLLMGRVYGNDTNVKGKMSGFVANPMERAEASKIAIYGVASYAWNLDKFDSNKTWQDAIAMLMPDSKEALSIFVKHNSDLGVNGHRFRREESVELKPVTNRILRGLETNDISNSDIFYVDAQFKKMVEASDMLLHSKDNLELLEEIHPWVLQFRNVAETGQQLVKMGMAHKSQDVIELQKRYNRVKDLKKAYYDRDQNYNQNPYQPGVKTASLVVVPFINKVFEAIVKDANEQYSLNLDSKSDFCPHQLNTNMVQFENALLQVKNNKVIIPPVLEVVSWKANDYMQLSLDKEYKGKSVELNFASTTVSTWLKVSISEDGKNWDNISFTQDKENLNLSLEGKQLKYIRFASKATEAKNITFKKLHLILE